MSVGDVVHLCFPMLLRDLRNMVRCRLQTESPHNFSMHTLHEVSVCALSKLRPRLLHGYNRMGGSGDAVDVSQKPVRDGVVGRCCWTTGRLYIGAPPTVPIESSRGRSL